jgi:signal transduction histidine kinase
MKAKNMNTSHKEKSTETTLRGISPWVSVLAVGSGVFSFIAIVYVTVVLQAATEIVLLILLVFCGELVVVSALYTRYRERAYIAEVLRLKDQFIFIAAHELRVPATAIKWAVAELAQVLASMMHERGSGEQHLDVLRKSSERLLALAEGLLEVARIENRTVQPHIQDVSVPETIGEIVAELNETASREMVTIRSAIPQDTPPLTADPLRLKEVLVNTLANAIKYNRRGGSVTISADADADAVTIHCADTGVGIAPEHHQQVFQKFWRAQTKKEVSGTGLGLFIVKYLVESMHGKIWFTSTLGKGTTFSFSFPRAVKK